jgi:Cap4 dsDNA endonuclease
MNAKDCEGMRGNLKELYDLQDFFIRETSPYQTKDSGSKTPIFIYIVNKLPDPLSLAERIIKTKPREKAGSVSSSRFDYQKDWSLCKLIDTHRSGTDYIAIFDWHEDLLIMDSEANPSAITFYQIKGKKSGNWSITSLLSSDKDKDGELLLSILGKLYDCKSKFDLETSSLNFISNARFNVKLASGEKSLSKDSICIIELSKEERDEIIGKIKNEHKIAGEPKFQDITFLKVADLSLDDSSGHAKGKITEFLEEIFPGKSFNVPSVYRMLFDEVKRRTSYNKDILTFDDLVKNKGIAKSQFESIISATGIKVDYKEIWRRAEIELQTSSVSFQDRRKIHQSWTRLELEKMEPNNHILFSIVAKVESIIIAQESNLVGLNFHQQVEVILSNLKSNHIIPTGYSDFFVKAIIIFEFYD